MASSGAASPSTPIGERHLHQPLRAHADIHHRDVLGEPGRVDRSAALAVAELAGGVVGQIRFLEGELPEALRGRRARASILVHANRGQQRTEVVQRPDERTLRRGPFGICGGDCAGERARPGHAQVRILNPQPERERDMRRFQLADGVVEVRQPARASGEQRLDEAHGICRARLDQRFPDAPRRFGLRFAGRDDAAVANPEVAAERGEHSRLRIDRPESRRVLRQVLQRGVVETGEAVTQERGALVGQNGREEIGGRHLALEDRAGPDGRRQRHRNQIDRHRERRDAAPVQRIGQGLDIDAEVGEQPDALLRLAVAVRLDRQRAAPLAESQADDFQQPGHLAPRTAIGRVGERQ